MQFRGELTKEYIVGFGGSVIRLKTRTHRHRFTTCLGMILPDRVGSRAPSASWRVLGYMWLISTFLLDVKGKIDLQEGFVTKEHVSTAHCRRKIGLFFKEGTEEPY